MNNSPYGPLPDPAAPILGEHWVIIERIKAAQPLAVGPYGSDVQAWFAMEESLLVQGLVEEDCDECFTHAGPPPADAELVLIDPTDRHHTGA